MGAVARVVHIRCISFYYHCCPGDDSIVLPNQDETCLSRRSG